MGAQKSVSSKSEPAVHSVSYPLAVGKFDKFEIDFQIELSGETNRQLPYLTSDNSSEFTVDLVGKGISVDGVFLSPTGEQHRQPAFWYEGYSRNLRANDESGWKARFSPHLVGEWAFQIEAVWEGGAAKSGVFSFQVDATDKDGFIRVSEDDSRYFEYDSGRYYSNVGLNIFIKDLDDGQTLAQLSDNGINYVRTWITPMNISGGAWPHLTMSPLVYDGYLPRGPLTRYQPIGHDREVFWWRLAADHDWYSDCFYTNQEFRPIQVKPDTEYRVELIYEAYDLVVNDSGKQSGLAVYFSDWVDRCKDLQRDDQVILYEATTNEANVTVAGTWFSEENFSIPFNYFYLDNVQKGNVYIRSFSIREVKPDGELGPELFDEHVPDKRFYYSQRESALLDQIIEEAAENGVHLRLVINEKEDPLWTQADGYGQPTEFARENFYGQGRALTHGRYLQMAYWRYVQARWGYSPAVHSWELLNEGDPFEPLHYTLADEFGIFMKCTVFGVEPEMNGKCSYDHPNHHLVSTSMWHSYPDRQFWHNSEYPNIDFGDVHRYIPADDIYHTDMTRSVLELFDVAQIGHENLRDKPIVRGETGIVARGTTGPVPNLQTGENQVWLHNMLWSSLGRETAIEAGYWYYQQHIFNSKFDLLGHYNEFARFSEDLGLNSGGYQSLNGVFEDESVVVVGQTDQMNGTAHGWLRHPDFTWAMVDSGQTEFGLSGEFALSNLQKSKQYQVELITFSNTDGYSRQIQSVDTNQLGDLAIFIETENDIGSIAFKAVSTGEKEQLTVWELILLWIR